jgi:hypothetical protein
VASVIDLVVFLRRNGRQRFVDEIAAVPAQLSDDVFTLDTRFNHSDGQLDQTRWWS